MNIHDLFYLFEEAFKEWNRDNVPLLAAGLAFYGLLSLSPFFILVMLIASSLMSREAIEGGITQQIGMLLDPRIAMFFYEMLDKSSEGAYSYKVTLLTILLLLFGAAGMFVHATSVLNLIWGRRTQKCGIIRATARSYLQSYLRSFLLISAIGFLLLASSVVTAVVLPMAENMVHTLPMRFGLLQILNFLISFLLITMLFALTYRSLSGVELFWNDVILGSAVTSLLFVVGNTVLGIYVGASNIGSLYGAASYLVVLLIWIYYSAQIFFFGAELIKVHRQMFHIS